jgi:hypothetical protein
MRNLHTAMLVLAIDPDFLVSPTYEGIRPQFLSEDVQGFSKCLPPALGVQFRPEQGEKCVSALVSVWTGKREVQQEGQSLRLT